MLSPTPTAPPTHAARRHLISSRIGLLQVESYNQEPTDLGLHTIQGTYHADIVFSARTIVAGRSWYVSLPLGPGRLGYLATLGITHLPAAVASLLAVHNAVYVSSHRYNTTRPGPSRTSPKRTLSATFPLVSSPTPQDPVWGDFIRASRTDVTVYVIALTYAWFAVCNCRVTSVPPPLGPTSLSCTQTCS